MDAHTDIKKQVYANREKIIKKSYHFSQQLHEFIEALTSTIDARDPYTAHHSWAVAEISELIAEKMLLSEEFIFLVHIAGHLHDIGKIGIPDSILLKQGRLSEEEKRIIQKHPQIGAEIVSKVEELSPVVEMVLYHHERWDGSGYPCGIRKKEIPLGARIIAIADSLDVMMSDRPYRPSKSFDASRGELRRGKAVLYDPEIVDAFLGIEQEKILCLYRD
jgi:putative nucleotidyltransferase with HDIG domain